MSISIAQPQLGQDEIEAITRVINSGMIASGPETLLLNKNLLHLLVHDTCAVNNGTSAICLH